MNNTITKPNAVRDARRKAWQMEQARIAATRRAEHIQATNKVLAACKKAPCPD